jgi:glyoxalase family protein
LTQQVRGLHAVRLRERRLGPTAAFLTAGLGFETLGEENGWHRFGLHGGGSGCLVEIEEVSERRGQWGPGIVHHVAWRVPDDDAERSARAQVYAAGVIPTEVIDRFWFKSVYFKEPGGVLFEIATDGPGFAFDEAEETLGERLILPPWLEPGRQEIERRLQTLRPPEPGRQEIERRLQTLRPPASILSAQKG